MLIYTEVYNYITTYLVTGPLAQLLSYTACVLVFILAVNLFMLICNIVKKVMWF